MDGANKGGVDEADEGGVGRTNKGRAGGVDKGEADEAHIDAGKKTGVGAVTSINNSVDDGNKVTDRRTGLVVLAFSALAAANCAKNSNLAIFEGTALGAATSILDEFLATFTALVNITLEREPKVCESSQFLFAVNHQ